MVSMAFLEIALAHEAIMYQTVEGGMDTPHGSILKGFCCLLLAILSNLIKIGNGMTWS